VKNIKGLVHPKMKILSVFTPPHVVPKMCLFVLLNTKEDIWKNVLIKQISIPIDYHSRMIRRDDRFTFSMLLLQVLP